MHIQVKWLGYASKQMGSSCNQGQGRHANVHILNTPIALFQSPEIREEDSKLSHVTWISSMDIENQKMQRAHHKRVWSFEIWISHQILNLELL